MTTDSAETWLSWIMAASAAGALVVGGVVARRWATRVVVLALGVLVFLLAFAARTSIGGSADRDVSALCSHGVNWYRVHFDAPGRLCGAADR